MDERLTFDRYLYLLGIDRLNAARKGRGDLECWSLSAVRAAYWGADRGAEAQAEYIR